jgi:hypothetical protein
MKPLRKSRKPNAMSQEPRELSVYDGSDYVGCVVIRGESFTSFDQSGRALGDFSSQREALAAFDAGGK